MPRVGCCLAALAVAGCGRTVAVEPLPMAEPGTATACATLVDRLPDRISVGRAWRVAPDPSSTAAWGSPPVVLRCGDSLPQPGPSDQLLSVNGTTWWVEQLSNGERYTSVDRTPGVIVSVPTVDRPSAEVLMELLPALQP